MVVAATALGCIYFALYLLARKETIEKAPSKLLRPFYRIALYLYKQASIKRLSFFRSRQVELDLQRLYPEEGREQLCAAYYVKKLALSLMICFVGTLLALVISLKAGMSAVFVKDNTVHRGTYEEGQREITIKTKLEKGGEQRFQVSVAPQSLSTEEVEKLKKAFGEQLPQLILGENQSLRSVSCNLRLDESFDGFPFAVEWKSNRPDLVSASGTVWEVEKEGEEVVLTAIVSYEDFSWKEVIAIRVVPPSMSEEEKLHKELEELITLSEQGSRGAESWELPGAFYEEKLGWQQVVEDNSIFLWVLAVTVAFAVYLFSDRDLHSSLLEKRASMKRDYPDVVHKLALYLGAGMTIRGALQRMSIGAPAPPRTLAPIYQEILYTCRELKSGVPEGEAYERLGKRTGLREYIRLCTLLTQNLKKGNAALLSRLQEEAQGASAERLQRSRKMSEEAGTKLLLPMIMMLVVVMVMIMLPAFSSMGV